ncbi:MAG TPA: hypothetical protein VKZ81_19165 [Pseudonocardia sp.]|jgi:RimJ/RimL family protein N-acetyltransferase|uniref:hypothetical protein n=1 Tax=Pseudonocardia sp. TaxID=60912 RepID=UPI002B4AF1CE|nr:hypothetical protein [Pseudonocardia sp.]HLU57581.1 hypothetical protein [Pseudonocardia sp.]
MTCRPRSAPSPFAEDVLGATDVYAGVGHGNVRSAALLARLGLTPVARFESYTRFHLPR